jgi:hypothetical protein
MPGSLSNGNERYISISIADYNYIISEMLAVEGATQRCVVTDIDNVMVGHHVWTISSLVPRLNVNHTFPMWLRFRGKMVCRAAACVNLLNTVSL